MENIKPQEAPFFLTRFILESNRGEERAPDRMLKNPLNVDLKSPPLEPRKGRKGFKHTRKKTLFIGMNCHWGFQNLLHREKKLQAH